MYDGAATCPANVGPAGMAALESAAYRMITASSQRAFQQERQWCFGGWKGHATGKPYRRGRRYAFDAWVKFVVSFLDSYELMQMTPCPGRTRPLRALLMSALEDAASASSSASSSSPSASPLSPAPPPLAWWEGPWITAVTNAFSCGFTEAEDLHRVLLHGATTASAAGNTNNNNNNNREYGYRNGLPSDIARGGGRGGSFAEDRVLQQAWRLTKGYMAGAQKQREKPLRQHDFDISLYVPFLVGNHLDPMYARYMGGGALRTGFPTYSGPAAWKVLHTLAARVAEVHEQCGDVRGAAVGGGAGGSGSGGGGGERSGSSSSRGSGSGSGGNLGNPLVESFKTTLTYFLINHPCPYCKEHFLSRLSRNDASWPQLGPLGASYAFPEVSIYPLEWLFAGGVEGVSFAQKLAAVTRADDVGLFMWKVCM